MKRLRLGENLTREWEADPFAYELWQALQLIKHDSEAGARNLEKLSEMGSPLSMMYLGTALFTGHYGLEKDVISGEHWLRSSIQAGSIEACYALGKLLSENDRPVDAIRMFECAEELGYAPAMYILGRAYYFGNGVSKNLRSSHYYYKKSAMEGHLYGVLWEAYTFKMLQKKLLRRLRYLYIRITIVFRLIFAIISYPSSDRLRR